MKKKKRDIRYYDPIYMLLRRLLDKQRTPQKRLKAIFQVIDRVAVDFKSTAAILADAYKQAEPNREWHADKFDLEDFDTFALIAEGALTLRPDSGADLPIYRAFEAAGLDPGNPISWRVLMMAFCWTHFAPPTSGRKKTYTAERYRSLLQAIDRLKINDPKLSDRRASTLLIKEKSFIAQFGHITDEGLRRALRQARNPEYNPELKRLVFEDVLSQQKDYARKHLSWPPSGGKTKLVRGLARYHADRIGGSWRGTIPKS